MGGHMDQDPIFQPLAFRNLTVKNRLFRSNISGRIDNYNGSGTPARIRFEQMFARGGVGAILSSHVPVAVEGRILPNYAMIDRDARIGFWRELVDEVHKFDCAYILQLSHSGHQQDIRGVENQWPGYVALSSTNTPDFFHGIPSKAMTIARDRRDGAALRRRRAEGEGGRLRRDRAARRQRLPVQPVPELGDQRPQGRVRRLAREPLSPHAPRGPRHPRRGRARLPLPGEVQRRRPPRRARALAPRGQQDRGLDPGRPLAGGGRRGRAPRLHGQLLPPPAEPAGGVPRPRRRRGTTTSCCRRGRTR